MLRLIISGSKVVSTPLLLPQRFGDVPEHALCLGKTLEAVVEGKLAADEVKLLVGVAVERLQARLGAVGGVELGREDGAAAVPDKIKDLNKPT
jgi:hypothetical protein